MRNALGLMLASVFAAVVIAAGGWFYYSSRADQAAPKTIAARAADPLPAQAKLAAKDDVATTAAIAAKPAAAAPAPAPAPMPVQQKSTCANPNALGVSRVVEIDTTGGPGFGFDHFKQFDFLTDKEVVLTFDDGPWPVNTPAVLKALADECTKGLFFSIGKHATYHPEILRQVLAQGHTVGAHTWSHVNLNGKKMTEQMAKDEVEKGFSAVKIRARHRPRTVLPLPAASAQSGDRELFRHPQRRDVLDRHRLLRLQEGRDTGEDHRDRDDQARQARQGHHPDARLPEAHRRSHAGAARAVEGRRLQDRADEGQDDLPDAAGI